MKPIYRCRVCGRYTEQSIHCGVPAELLLDPRRRVMLSKLVSGLLRHYPWEAGLKLSREGWVSIDELVKGIRERWRNRDLYQWVRREHVEALAQLDPKGRFEIRNGMIRARYGHSVEVSITYEEHYPNVLYHGTSRDRLQSIFREGLKPMKRRFVHATTDIEQARETGRRHGSPVVLRIDVGCLKNRGIPVYRATSTIYLIPYVPKQCIEYIG